MSTRDCSFSLWQHEGSWREQQRLQSFLVTTWSTVSRKEHQSFQSFLVKRWSTLDFTSPRTPHFTPDSTLHPGLHTSLRWCLWTPASSSLMHPLFLLRHQCQPILPHVRSKSYVAIVFGMTTMSTIDNVQVVIGKKVDLIISAGSIYVSKTNRHSNARMTIPSRGGMVVFF